MASLNTLYCSYCASLPINRQLRLPGSYSPHLSAQEMGNSLMKLSTVRLWLFFFFFFWYVTLTACNIVEFLSVFMWYKGPLSESFWGDKRQQSPSEIRGSAGPRVEIPGWSMIAQVFSLWDESQTGIQTPQWFFVFYWKHFFQLDKLVTLSHANNSDYSSWYLCVFNFPQELYVGWKFSFIIW